MTILVISDTHGDIGRALKLAAELKPDMIWHLGDTSVDARDIARSTGIPTVTVIGNNDYSGDKFKVEQVGDYKFYLTHGYNEFVDVTYERVAKAAKSAGAYAALFGHTHTVCDELDADTGVRLWNPGSLSRPRLTKSGKLANPSFALLTVEPDSEPKFTLMESQR